jgi:hypothetical protein
MTVREVERPPPKPRPRFDAYSEVEEQTSIINEPPTPEKSRFRVIVGGKEEKR